MKIRIRMGGVLRGARSVLGRIAEIGPLVLQAFGIRSRVIRDVVKGAEVIEAGVEAAEAEVERQKKE